MPRALKRKSPFVASVVRLKRMLSRAFREHARRGWSIACARFVARQQVSSFSPFFNFRLFRAPLMRVRVHPFAVAVNRTRVRVFQ